MANTTNFNWATPDDTDLVKDGAAAIRTLGSSIDTSFVDLKGGTTGQVLSKATNTDLDYTWITPNVGDITEVQAGVGISVASGTGPIPVITNSSTDLITTAGDLLYGTAADTVARLGIGTAGQVLKVNSGATAPEWGAAASSFVGAFVYNNAAQTIANGTSTVVTFNSESYDTDGFHSTVTNTGRLTIPTGKGGKYLIGGQIFYSANATGKRNINVRKNGSGGFYGTVVPTAASGGTVLETTVLVDLAATDYVELMVEQSSGGNLDVGDVTFGSNYFFCALIGA